MAEISKSIEVQILGSGTSQGVPVIACDCAVCSSIDPLDKRLRTSILIRSEKTSVVVDTGPDFRQQMLSADVQRLDAVVFTHEHKDHTAGLDDVRAFNFKQDMDMPIYGNENVKTTLYRDFHYAFGEPSYPGVPQLDFKTINGEFTVGDLTFIPIEVWHYKLPVYGFRVGDFCYVTDANHIEEEEIEKMKGCKVLVINALRKEKHVSHFNVAEAIDMSRRIGAGTTYFTHISHLMGFHDEVSKELPQGVHLAHDGLKISI